MAGIYKRGKTYWIKWHENGKAKYESLKTQDKKEALIAKAAKELELRTGGVSVAQSNCTVEEFSHQYMLWHKGEYPWAEKELRYCFDSTILPEFGHRRLASLDPRDVEMWKHKRLSSIGHRSGKPISRTTVNNDLKRLRAMVNKAVEWGVIPRNTIASVKTLQKVHSAPRSFFTAEQLEAIYEQDVRYAPVFQLLANTGMRLGEAMHLKWTDVGPKTIRVASTEEYMTKSRKWRDIPISPGASDALRQLDATSTYVLPRVHLRTIRYRFKRACKLAGIEGTPHELRHTFISQLVMQGVPLRTVQVLAGHSTVAITEEYAHLAPNHLSDAVANLSL